MKGKYLYQNKYRVALPACGFENGFDKPVKVESLVRQEHPSCKPLSFRVRQNQIDWFLDIVKWFNCNIVPHLYPFGCIRNTSALKVWSIDVKGSILCEYILVLYLHGLKGSCILWAAQKTTSGSLFGHLPSIKVERLPSMALLSHSVLQRP